MTHPDTTAQQEPQENGQDPKIKKSKPKLNRSSVVDWGYILFVTVCCISFLAALVITLDIPLKWALIAGLTPVGVFFVILVFLFCCLKWELRAWMDNYKRVSANETTTSIIKSLLLPALLAILYFYIRGEEGQNTLYTSSPVSYEMIVHPCGSSYQKTNRQVLWDAVDLISQPSQSEVFVVTNAVPGINQTRGACPQTGAFCSTSDINPGRQRPKWLSKVPWIFAHDFSQNLIWNPVSCPRPDDEDSEPHCPTGIVYDNGIQTGDCYNDQTCVIDGWCPPISLQNFSPQAIFDTADFTIFLDMRPNFPEFKVPSWTKGGYPDGYSANYADIYARYHKYSRSVETCVYNSKQDPYCPRFRLKDIVDESKSEGVGYIGNWTEAESLGGQFKIEVDWSCKFDWGKDIFDCLPQYRFIFRGTNKGKPKIFPRITFQDDHSRIVTYTLGISISISHVGRGMQIQLYNLFFYSQFIYVSYTMLKGPVLWIIRCIIATFFTAKEGGKRNKHILN